MFSGKLLVLKISVLVLWNIPLELFIISLLSSVNNTRSTRCCDQKKTSSLKTISFLRMDAVLQSCYGAVVGGPSLSLAARTSEKSLGKQRQLLQVHEFRGSLEMPSVFSLAWKPEKKNSNLIPHRYVAFCSHTIRLYLKQQLIGFVLFIFNELCKFFVNYIFFLIGQSKLGVKLWM